MGTRLSQSASAGALSVAVLDGRLVDQQYATYASIYNRLWGRLLHAGRREAVLDLGVRTGDRVLEVGIGTGLTAPFYPSSCTVTGIDSSEAMLREAARYLSAWPNIRLERMDAERLRFPDRSFDVVYGAYVISVVADPVAVLKEMRRVCRPGGHIVLLNHFLSLNPVAAALERLISPLTARLGFRADLDLDELLSQAGLDAISVRTVRRTPLWTLVRCRRDRD
jgi:phosphatidylethanolamine/phosphatidyl-N-methylethanolamine N-methyltransferase